MGKHYFIGVGLELHTNVLSVQNVLIKAYEQGEVGDNKVHTNIPYTPVDGVLDAINTWDIDGYTPADSRTEVWAELLRLQGIAVEELFDLLRRALFNYETTYDPFERDRWFDEADRIRESLMRFGYSPDALDKYEEELLLVYPRVKEVIG